MKRFLWLTFLWMFLWPVYFNRVQQLYPSVGGKSTRRYCWRLCGRALRRGRLLRAFELFWSAWNPVITYPLTKPLYRMVGGNKHPLIATLITFIYSGVFLHGLAGLTPIIVWINMAAWLIYGEFPLSGAFLCIVLYGMVSYIRVLVLLCVQARH